MSVNLNVKLKLAKISFKQAKNECLDWVATGAPHFMDVNIADLSQTDIDRIWQIYKEAYEYVSAKLFLNNVFLFTKYVRWICLLNKEKQIEEI